MTLKYDLRLVDCIIQHMYGNIIEPINIIISDNKKFGDVAFLVDRDDFLDDVVNLRKKWNIEKLYKRGSLSFHWSEYPIEFQKTRLELLEKHNHDKLKAKIVNAVKQKDIAEWEIEVNKVTEEYIKELNNISIKNDVVFLRNKYKRASNFDTIIAHSVLYGEIRDKDYVTVLPLLLLKKRKDSLIPGDIQPVPAIAFFPLAKPEEVINVYTKSRNALLKQYSEIIKLPSFNLDTISNIKRDREWYWLKKNSDLGYGKLFNTVGDKEPITFDGFKKAIQQYQRRLTGEI